MKSSQASDEEIIDMVINETIKDIRTIAEEEKHYAIQQFIMQELQEESKPNIEKFINIKNKISSIDSDEMSPDAFKFFNQIKNQCDEVYKYEGASNVIGAYEQSHKREEKINENSSTAKSDAQISKRIIPNMLEITKNYIKYLSDEKIKPHASVTIPGKIRAYFFKESTEKKFMDYNIERNYIEEFLTLLTQIKNGITSSNTLSNTDVQNLSDKFDVWYQKYQTRIEESEISKKAQYSKGMKMGINTLKTYLAENRKIPTLGGK